MRCDRCGKFRKRRHVVASWHGETHDGGEVTECVWCMSDSDYKFYGMTGLGGETDE